MKAMRWLGPLMVVVVAILGALAGWVAAPRYTPPPDDGEERLRQRAVEFFRAQQRFDQAAIQQLYTPARQLAEAADLREVAREKEKLYANMHESTKSDLEENARGITPERITIEREGDWALTSGSSMISEDGYDFPLELGKVAWYRDAGEWWIFEMRLPELAAYGNPPDLVRNFLKKPGNTSPSSIQMMPEPDAKAEAPADAATDGQPVEDNTLAENSD